MLVSHWHKFIYTKTLKTAGTSVEVYFEKYCVENPDTAITTESRLETVSAAGIVGARSMMANGKHNDWWNHMAARQIREKLGAPMFDAYFKFCCIRNPFDKALSAFFWYEANGLTGTAKQDGETGEADAVRFERWLTTKGPPGDRNKYVVNGEYCMDTVIRYESLTADMERVCGVLGLPWEPERVPSFKTGVRPDGLSIEQMYTERSRRVVEELYAFELERFGYSFPASVAETV